MRDYHVHSKVSPDGHDTLACICKTAISKGITELVVTDHFEFYTEDFIDNRFHEAYLDFAYEQVLLCKQKFAGKLDLRFGLEAGQPHQNPTYAQKILSAYPFDYIIGSVHKMNNLDLSTVPYQEIDVNELIKRNLTSLHTLAKEGDFDCIGHFDLMKRYASRAGVTIDMMQFKAEITEIFDVLIQREKGIELNMSGLYQATKEPFPSKEILKLYKACGGEIITVGSDSHRAADVGKGCEEGRELLRSFGFVYEASYQNRNLSFKAL